jgi:hypothetical protein
MFPSVTGRAPRVRRGGRFERRLGPPIIRSGFETRQRPIFPARRDRVPLPFPGHPAR